MCLAVVQRTMATAGDVGDVGGGVWDRCVEIRVRGRYSKREAVAPSSTRVLVGVVSINPTHVMAYAACGFEVSQHASRMRVGTTGRMAMQTAEVKYVPATSRWGCDASG